MAIVTLTSDFGIRDYVAGAFKGRMLRQYHLCRFVDISHDTEAFNVAEAAYMVRNSMGHFPEHSYHLVLVNLFDHIRSLPVLAYHGGQYFGAPDNGLLPLILGGQPDFAVLLPIAPALQYDTFAWADAFGKAIRHIEEGQPLHTLGTETDGLEVKHALLPNFGPDFIDGRIIFIDRFENVVVNITRNDFDRIGKGRPFIISYKGREKITRLSEGYPQVNEGNSLAFFNAAGYLEIAINKGNAAGLFGLQTFNHLTNPELIKSRMFYQTVRILFT